MPKRKAGVWDARREEALAMLAAGAHDAELMAHFRTTRSAVTGFRHREGVFLDERKGPRSIPLRASIRATYTSTVPPSLAMIRLAEFDPVVARALALRSGQKDSSAVMAATEE